MISITYCVHIDVDKECSKVIKECHGRLTKYDAKCDDDSKFEKREVHFDNIEDANSFMYKAFFRFGLNFFLTSMTDISFSL